jgi:hypothetical protein
MTLVCDFGQGLRLITASEAKDPKIRILYVGLPACPAYPAYRQAGGRQTAGRHLLSNVF